ncbi:MAG TPA: GNAT family N-acetyltransferase [Sphingomicrobium sp.]|nr:GNAT family N-acetyltransferase [Sphingomicrobium sp.]
METDRIYFDMGAEQLQLGGAILAWMPGLTRSAAAAVIHRVEPEAIAAGGAQWVALAEQALSDRGTSLARIYLDERHQGADEILRRAGYADRDELAFVHNLPDPPDDMSLRPVVSDRDWTEKLRFHEEVDQTPDGHRNRAADWVELERRKSAAGMDCYLVERGREIVGAVGAIWGDHIVRIKNLVVHPGHRRQTIGRAILCQMAALGRARGVFEQCVMAVRGEAGEQLYRATGMNMVGLQVEWSKQLQD